MTTDKAIYDARYYGLVDPPRANYRHYGPSSVPHWSMPLARWLVDLTSPVWLDLGCAFGHLVRDLNLLLPPERGAKPGIDNVVAWGVEWSDTASTLRVTEYYTHADARLIETLFPPGGFGTVVSLDFLEHFTPADAESLIGKAYRLTRPGGYSIHLIGAYDPATDIAEHMGDPTHINHEPLDWYRDAFLRAGFELDPGRTASLNRVPAWAATDWNGRMLAFRKPEGGING